MKKYLQNAINAAVDAGKEIMKIYQKDFVVEFKEDQSPLTEADKESNRIIGQYLHGTFPIISEENKLTDYEVRKNWDTYWLIDPIDGTKEFVKKNGEFTVNIALIKGGTPILGVVYLPAKRVLYFAAEGMGSYRYSLDEKASVPELQDLIGLSASLDEAQLPEQYTIVASRSHMSADTESFIERCKHQHGDVQLISQGSSIKLCLVAEGSAHVYPRLAPTMEWDTAAAHAVAKYAGCQVLNFDTNEALMYNKENLLNPHFIVLR